MQLFEKNNWLKQGWEEATETQINQLLPAKIMDRQRSKDAARKKYDYQKWKFYRTHQNQKYDGTCTGECRKRT